MMWMAPLDLYCGTMTSASQVVLSLFPYSQTPTKILELKMGYPQISRNFYGYISYIIDANCSGWWFQPL